MAFTHAVKPPVIRILFYAPGTGFGTTVKNIPFTVAHATFGDAEVNKQKQSGVKFDITTAFTVRGAVKDNRMIPGYIQLTDSGSVTDIDNQMPFDPSTGSTAGHTYQRLIDYVISAKALNSTKVKFFAPIYSIYTVVDAPGSNTNLSYLFNSMKSAGYPDSFFDVCITASKGISSLVPTIEHYNMDTTLVLINGGASGYLTDKLSVGSKVRAVILTQGDNDTQVVDKKFVSAFLNGNSTKLFIYSNKKDGHNQASLILGDTSSLDKSLSKKTNRTFRHSYLPLLVNSVYYVGRRGASWGHLTKILKKDKFVNSDTIMIGGTVNGPIHRTAGDRTADDMLGGTTLSSRRHNNCGCGDSMSRPIYDPDSDKDVDNHLTMRRVMELYCDCDRYHPQDTGEMRGGGKKKEPDDEDDKSDNRDKNQIDKDNLHEHLYPETNDEPFSDLEDSPKDPEDDPEEQDAQNPQNVQKGGGILEIDNEFIGRSLTEIIYQRNKMDYVQLSIIASR